MHNCLKTYVSLAECVLDHEGAGKWAIAEIKGKMNQPPRPRLVEIATVAVGKVNASHGRP